MIAERRAWNSTLSRLDPRCRLIHHAGQGQVLQSGEALEMVGSRRARGMRGGKKRANHAGVVRERSARHRWAQPVYQGTWTALLLGDAVLSETLYAWTDRMVPSGYWTTKTALDCLRRERAGEFPSGVYLRYVMLESEFDHDRRREALEQIVELSPGFAPAWKDLVSCV